MSSSSPAAWSTSSSASRPWLLGPLVVLILLLAACGGNGGDGADLGDSEDIKVSPVAGSPMTGAPQATTPAPSPASGGAVNAEAVRFETPDGVAIAGHLYTAPGPRRKVVVLAHELPRDQTAWRDFARELAAQGVHALTFDFRGYGETGGTRDIARNDVDLEYAVRFIRSRDYAQVYVFGASMGGTAALKVAARLDLAGVVTLSAPPVIMGLDARPDVARITEPKLFIAGRGDEGGAYVAAAQAFMNAAPAPKEEAYFDTSAHGTAMLSGPSGAAVKQLLFDFLERH